MTTGAVASDRHVARVGQHRHSGQHLTWHTARVIVTEYVVDRESGCDTYTAHTSSGSKPHWGEVAVDTRQFPYGTHFIIPGYGPAIARDTGGYVGWNHIDAAVVSAWVHRHGKRVWRSGCDIALNDWGTKHLTVLWR